MQHKLIEKILKARVYDVAHETPLEKARSLSTRFDNTIYLKREDLQPVFSFKLRGSFNCMQKLSSEAKARGVIAASAGNHAQGMAYAGSYLGIPTTIVMPVITPEIKVKSVRAFGGNAVLHGNNFNEAYQYATELCEKEKLTFVHPFDDLEVIAGQGTVGMEITRQHPDPIDAIFICCGGGGLLSGIGSWMKYLSPQTRIIGVEHEEAPSMTKALAAGERILLDQIGTFADGAAVKQAGVNTFAIAQQVVDEMITVTTDETCAAIKDVFEDTRTLLEPAGALGVAGLKKYLQHNDVNNQELVAICSGANVNFDRLRHVAERAELGENREALFAVTVPEQPGSFHELCQVINNRSITEFNYRYANHKEAKIFLGVNTSDTADKNQFINELNELKYPVIDLSDNEVAKVHLRFMVGGHATGLKDELLFRCRFPEQPGALLHFLDNIGHWNISLFHYRNHGSDFGRVLVGIQVPAKEHAQLIEHLDQLGYDYQEETTNPAYQHFLR
ncbi:MAG: threonine ammonia-lyase, biosynthetic [Leucothrix sp.]